ncbi:type IV pilus inner membrane component PilO [Phytohalomonas tamaricis]|uniref:type 4a pilus biogenesis protein PilO n=1 Tax=Phytohalomonas tamaricis TaxID=2081032 RepID=UPI000D0AF138|nr:type 4a pilus biogenesis protein PilO [Phytohalomonas tamaricis]
MNKLRWQTEWKHLRELDVASLDIKEAGNWPLLLKVLCCVLIVVGVFFAAQWYVVSPREQALEQSRAKEQALMTQFGMKSFQAANLALLKEQMDMLDHHMARLVSMLPTDAEVPALLDDISDTARAHRLGIDFVRLAAPVVHDFYTEQPFNIQVVGDYHRIAAFVSGVAGLPRIVTLHDFTLTPRTEAKGASKSSSDLTLTMVAKTYRYDTDPPESTDKPTPKRKGGQP